MKQLEGHWMPDILSAPGRYLKAFGELKPTIEEYCVKRRSVVQAGGHIGLFPLELSRMFQAVYTFEPHPENFACLVRNAPAPNVFPMRAFVGDIRGSRELQLGKGTGGHAVGKGVGLTPTLRIDDLALDDCDLLLLDLEGYEFYALLGAMTTLAISRPLIICEENKKSKGQGMQAGALALLLGSRGYKQRVGVGENLVFESRK